MQELLIPGRIRFDYRKHMAGFIIEDLHYDKEKSLSFGEWNIIQKSRFIESMMLRFPFSPLYVVDLEYIRNLFFLDGLKRVETMKEFVGNAFTLTGTEFSFHEPLEGKRYEELPRHLQRRILETEFIVWYIQHGSYEYPMTVEVLASLARRLGKDFP